MNGLAAVIGWAFIAAVLIGALIPGMNFHVVLGGDETSIEFHKKMADKVQNRLDKKNSK